jgi:DNA-binding LytR/AlgR family response regulator
MNILLIEDETAAAKQLRKMILETEPSFRVMTVLESVRETVLWLQTHTPDLIISDIQLADGISFDIFGAVKTNIPVIFTTAYDEYMQRAFKINSIDYLLKPIDKTELAAAFNKFRSLQTHPADIFNKLSGILKNMPVAKSRFLVKKGSQYVMVTTDDISFIKADVKIVFLHTNAGDKYIIDESLDELEQLLDTAKFFRLNRRYLVPATSIQKIHSHFNGRLKIEVKGTDDKEIFVSKEKAAQFKLWLNN